MVVCFVRRSRSGIRDKDSVFFALSNLCRSKRLFYSFSVTLSHRQVCFFGIVELLTQPPRRLVCGGVKIVHRRTKKIESYIAATLCHSCGTTGNRTRDTRIFSPLLYQLSYGTITDTSFRGSWCKGRQKNRISKPHPRFFLFFADFCCGLPPADGSPAYYRYRYARRRLRRAAGRKVTNRKPPPPAGLQKPSRNPPETRLKPAGNPPKISENRRISPNPENRPGGRFRIVTWHPSKTRNRKQ